MDNRVLGMLMRVVGPSVRAMQIGMAHFNAANRRHRIRAEPGMGKVTIGKDSGVRKRIRAIQRNGAPPAPAGWLERARERHVHPRSKRRVR